jgi:hypothetical protein
MHIANPRGSQLCPQRLPVELRIVSGSRDTAYVYDALDAVRSQKIAKIVPRMGRMPNRKDNGLCGFGPSHNEHPFSTGLWR